MERGTGSMTGAPPWDELDPGIREVVRAAWDAGFDTVSSCQGHVASNGTRGDAFVTFLPRHGEDALAAVKRVLRWLQLQGWADACIIEARWYVSEARLSEGPWVTVWWWGELPYRGEEGTRQEK